MFDPENYQPTVVAPPKPTGISFDELIARFTSIIWVNDNTIAVLGRENLEYLMGSIKQHAYYNHTDDQYYHESLSAMILTTLLIPKMAMTIHDADRLYVIESKMHDIVGECLICDKDDIKSPYQSIINYIGMKNEYKMWTVAMLNICSVLYNSCKFDRDSLTIYMDAGNDIPRKAILLYAASYKGVTVNRKVRRQANNPPGFNLDYFKDRYFKNYDNPDIHVDMSFFPIFSWTNTRTFSEVVTDIGDEIQRMYDEFIDNNDADVYEKYKSKKKFEKGKSEPTLDRKTNDELIGTKSNSPFLKYIQEKNTKQIACIVALLRMTSVSCGDQVLTKMYDARMGYYDKLFKKKDYQDRLRLDLGLKHIKIVMQWILDTYVCSYNVSQQQFRPSKPNLWTEESSGRSYTWLNLYPGIKYKPRESESQRTSDDKTHYRYALRMAKAKKSYIAVFNLQTFGVGEDDHNITRDNLKSYPFVEPSDQQVKYYLGYDKYLLTGYKIPVLEFKYSKHTGTGKTVMASDLPSKQLGHMYVGVGDDTRLISGEFNSIIDSKLLVVLDDIKRTKGDGFMEKIKSIITNVMISLRKLYENQKTVINNVSIRICANDIAVIEVELNDRRIFAYVVRPHPGGWTKDDLFLDEDGKLPKQVKRSLPHGVYDRLFKHNGSMTGVEVTKFIAALIKGINNDGYEYGPEFQNYMDFLHIEDMCPPLDTYMSPPPMTGLKQELIRQSSTPYRFIMNLIKESCSKPLSNEDANYGMFDSGSRYVPKIKAYTDITENQLYELYLRSLYYDKSRTLYENKSLDGKSPSIDELYNVCQKYFPVLPQTFQNVIENYLGFFGVELQDNEIAKYTDVLYRKKKTQLYSIGLEPGFVLDENQVGTVEQRHKTGDVTLEPMTQEPVEEVAAFAEGVPIN